MNLSSLWLEATLAMYKVCFHATRHINRSYIQDFTMTPKPEPYIVSDDDDGFDWSVYATPATTAYASSMDEYTTREDNAAAYRSGKRPAVAGEKSNFTTMNQYKEFYPARPPVGTVDSDLQRAREMVQGGSNSSSQHQHTVSTEPRVHASSSSAHGGNWSRPDVPDTTSGRVQQWPQPQADRTSRAGTMSQATQERLEKGSMS